MVTGEGRKGHRASGLFDGVDFQLSENESHLLTGAWSDHPAAKEASGCLGGWDH